MSKKYEDIFLKNIENTSPNTDDYNRFVGSWQVLVDDYHLTNDNGHRSENAQKMLAKIEGVANKVLLVLAARDEQAGEAVLLDDEFSSLPGSLLLVSASGTILDLNEQAGSSLEVRRGEPIDHLGFVLDNEQKLAATITSVANAQEEADRVALIRGTKAGDSRHMTIAVVQSVSIGEEEPRALVILIDAQWNPMASELVATNFKLTQTEIEIIEGFVAGHSLKDLAKLRGRSYTTIRNQFQSILDKTGSNSQAELLNLLLSVSTMFSRIVTPTTKPTTTKYRRQIEVMRPHGRFVDVLLHGDLNGTPVISLPSIFGHATTPEIEKRYHQAGLMIIGIGPPGFGKTSPESKGQEAAECLAGDICAVLDTLEIEKCVFVGRASAARSLFQLGALIPERMERAILINGVVPRKYIPGKTIVSKWAASLMSASNVSPAVATLIMGTGSQLLLRIGARRFIGKMYDRSPVDQLVVQDISVAKSIEAGARFTLEQGLKAGTIHMIDGFKDWSADVDACQVPMVLVDGISNPQISIEASRAFAAAYPNKMQLVEILDGGGLLGYTHVDLLIKMMLGQSPHDAQTNQQVSG